ncbi:arsenate reductase (glutaredoxin) [Robertkochia aurantiaca]|uniref:arsenate reductase (glutaredoxin) n=1 Tax=Robertkochia aurantiaca TaxID=2873700 RepID=UPI001CCFD5D3|nr:arsenate reductase (glutaredoxin) [Robertkochia sp. 3YJGBD-33]
MIRIYHNPRCRKSREGLNLVEESGQKYQVIKYLEEVPDEAEIRELLECLELKPIQLIRKNEAVWKEKFKGKDLTDEEIIKAMVDHPKLIERPIVVKNKKAVLGRPPENIKELL